MSSRRASLSSVLDRLQAWGDPPVVNPVRASARVTPPKPPEGPRSPARLAGLALWTFLALTAILVVWLVTTSAGTGFIYAQF